MSLTHVVYRILVSVFCLAVILALPVFTNFLSFDEKSDDDYEKMEQFRAFCIAMHYLTFAGVIVSFSVFCALYFVCHEDYLVFPEIIEGFLATYTIASIVTFILVGLFTYLVSFKTEVHLSIFSEAGGYFLYPLTEGALLVCLVIDCIYVFFGRDII